jgi:hypothetical protein
VRFYLEVGVFWDLWPEFPHRVDADAQQQNMQEKESEGGLAGQPINANARKWRSWILSEDDDQDGANGGK